MSATETSAANMAKAEIAKAEFVAYLLSVEADIDVEIVPLTYAIVFKSGSSEINFTTPDTISNYIESVD